MFPNLEDAPEAAHCGVADEDIFRRMQKHSQGDMILKEDDDIYKKGDILRSFHHRDFPLFPRSYQDVVTDQMVTDRMKDQISLFDDLSSRTH